MKHIISRVLIGTAVLVLATMAAGAEEVPDTVTTTIEARAPATGAPLQPDDARLVDLVRLIKSGISESIIAEQVRQSDPPFNLSVKDLLYLKQNGVQESTIGALMATGAGTRRQRHKRPRPLRPPAPESDLRRLVLVRPSPEEGPAGSAGHAG